VEEFCILANVTASFAIPPVDTVPNPSVDPLSRRTASLAALAEMSAGSPDEFADRPMTESAPESRSFVLPTALAVIVVATVFVVVTSPVRFVFVMEDPPENTVRFPLDGDPVVETVPDPPPLLPHAQRVVS
jgi:hypothetical protein